VKSGRFAGHGTEAGPVVKPPPLSAVRRCGAHRGPAMYAVPEMESPMAVARHKTEPDGAPSTTTGVRQPWYVVRTHHLQELRAEASLRAGAIETFLPWIRVLHRAPRARANEPLFPQYLFARFSKEQSLHDIAFSRGVQRVVSVGGSLATVDEGVIQLFQSRVDTQGLLRCGGEFQRGESVQIAHGPFADLAGVVDRVLPAHERVVILLSTAEATMRVELTVDQVRAQSRSTEPDSRLSTPRDFSRPNE
jgi:transcription antitermination factor NusG